MHKYVTYLQYRARANTLCLDESVGVLIHHQISGDEGDMPCCQVALQLLAWRAKRGRINTNWLIHLKFPCSGAYIA